MEDLLYTVAEVSKLLKVNVHAVYKLINKGHLRALKLGNLKIPKAELVRFINDNTGKDLSDLDNVTELAV